MPLIFDSHQNLSDVLFDDPLLVFAIEELGAVITLHELEEPHLEVVPIAEEVLS
ncbi:MAG: hypothetical protein K8I82_28985 [Anaerolineae bacterium]|nr:hypothetical protein [Anaerolineae bacterium]